MSFKSASLNVSSWGRLEEQDSGGPVLFLARVPRKWCALPRRATMSVCHITGDVKFDLLVKVVSARFLLWIKWQKPFQSLSSGLCPSDNYSLSPEAGLRFFKLCLYNLTYTLILNFYFPEPRDYKFLLFKPKWTNNKLCTLWCMYKLCNYDVQTQCTNQGQARLLVEALTEPGVISNRFL